MSGGVGKSGSPIERSNTSRPATSASRRFRSSSAKRYLGSAWRRLLGSGRAIAPDATGGQEGVSRAPVGRRIHDDHDFLFEANAVRLLDAALHFFRDAEHLHG